jgi:hypothetical protein
MSVKPCAQEIKASSVSSRTETSLLNVFALIQGNFQGPRWLERSVPSKGTR